MWTVLRDGKRYNLHFEKGENIGGLKAEPYTGRTDRHPHPLEARS